MIVKLNLKLMMKLAEFVMIEKLKKFLFLASIIFVLFVLKNLKKNLNVLCAEVKFYALFEIFLFFKFIFIINN